MLSEKKIPSGKPLSREDIAKEVKQIVAESSGMSLEQIHDTTVLRELPWDSLDYVECSMELEEQYDISIPDELIDEAKTIWDLEERIMALLVQSRVETKIES
jgi:acyl carrier protein